MFALHRNLRMTYVSFCDLFTYMEEFYQSKILLAITLTYKYFSVTLIMKTSPRSISALNEICDSIISSSQSSEIRYAVIRTKLDAIDSSYQPLLISLYVARGLWLA